METTSKPVVSDSTATWNRAAYLEQVWNGLNSQTYRNFEWLVADDGFDDETDSVVSTSPRHQDFPCILVIANVYIGKARIDNELVAGASVEFMVWNGSDRYLAPQAI